jgi:hypothetical protein
MHIPLRHAIAAVMMLTAVVALGGCASTDYLPVRYQLPHTADPLAGRQVALEVIDQRSRTVPFGPTMSQTFRHFTGNFALSVARGDERGILLGAFDLTGLFRRAITERLSASGVQVLDAASPATPRMTMVLTRFVMDHDETRWTAQVDYRVELSGTGTRRASQNISATEERLRLPGSRDAGPLLSDIFTETINRLDLARLFADAGI